MKKLRLKQENSEYITADEWRFIEETEKRLDTRIVTKLELPYEDNKAKDHRFMAKDKNSKG